jgi:hypothetical protein
MNAIERQARQAIKEVESLGVRLGWGALMVMVGELWKKHSDMPGVEFSIGPCDAWWCLVDASVDVIGARVAG